jgi:hypothetical protein
VDFVAANEAEDEWKLVLVEEGPWKGPVTAELRRVQNRLYGCLDGALDGKVAQQFPGSKGKRIVIRLDCYNVPKAEVVEFFDKFSQGVLRTPDYREALRNSKVVRDISFEINFDSVH